MSNSYPSAMAGDLELEEDNVIPMIPPASAGKEPPNDWLRGLPIGTVFLTRHGSMEGVFLTQCLIKNRTTTSTLLVTNGYLLNQEVWVDSARFPVEYTLIEILRMK